MEKDTCFNVGEGSDNSIPVINFNITGELREGTSSWSSIQVKVREALETYGCFEGIFGDVPLYQEMMHVIEQWFDLPLEMRQKHPSNDRMKGKANSITPLLENMDIIDSLNHARVESFNLIFPESNPKFCETIYSFAKQGSVLEKTVKRMIFESFGAGSYYDSLADSTTYWTRFNKYRVPKINETNVGLVKHTDSSFLTLLSQNDVNGLDIQDKNGKWFTIVPSPYSYVVLIGDALMAWSNGRLHSPPHRVIMNEGKARYSTAFFSYIDGVIEIPEELVDEKHPLRFKPFNHLEFRRFRSTEEGRKAESAIKAYCGVGEEPKLPLILEE